MSGATVTLWKCRECGDLSLSHARCALHRLPDEDTTREPIVFAPLPSAETRALVLELMDYKVRSMGDQNTKRVYANALAELTAKG